MDIKLLVGNKIKKIRIEKGISQELLADKSNLHRTYISSVERGIRNISVENLQKIAVALNVNASDLLIP